MLVSQRLFWLLAVLALARAEPPVNGVRPSNVLGGLEQHASFSFVRPGLTQTAYAFNGPSSHQAFSSSVGDPHLAHRVQPSLANALAYRNPGLGYIPVGPISTGYAAGPPPAIAYQPQQQQQYFDYQQSAHTALGYQQQLQQLYSGYAQQLQAQPAFDAASAQQSVQQAHLARLLAARFAQPEQAVPEQIQLQQQQQQQAHEQHQSSAQLLGVAYSAAPSVAHVKVNGNGYKFDF